MTNADIFEGAPPGAKLFMYVAGLLMEAQKAGYIESQGAGRVTAKGIAAFEYLKSVGYCPSVENVRNTAMQITGNAEVAELIELIYEKHQKSTAVWPDEIDPKETL